MIPETLAIDELVLRVPGLEHEVAKRLAEEVAQILSLELTELPMLPEGVSLRLRISSDVPPNALAAHLAEQIVDGLR